MSVLSKTFGKLSLLQKFVLITAPLVLAFAYLFFNYYETANGLMASSQDEETGASYLATQVNMMQQLQLHRSLNSMIKNGQPVDGNELSKAEKSVDTALADLLKTMPSDWVKTHAAYETIQKQWEGLKRNNLTMSAKRNFEEHTALIGKVIAAIRLAADESQMTLDPEVSGYYLVSPANFQLPLIEENVAKLRGSLAGVLASGQNPERALGEAEAIMDNVEILSEDVLQSLYKVKETGLAVPESLIKDTQKLVDNNKEARQLLGDIANNPQSHESKALFDQFSGWINDQTKVQNEITDLLNATLSARVDSMRAKLEMTVAIALFVFGFACVLGAVIFRGINKDVDVLRTQADNLAKGDMQKTALVESSDELGQISKFVEQIRVSQNTILASIQTACENLMHHTESLSVATEQVNAGATEQSDSASAVASSVEELSVSVSQVSDYANQAHDLAKSTGESASIGQERVVSTRNAMQTIEEASRELAASIDSLGERSDGISSIVQTIQAIAEQTNLLALNAAIEAARAGEQGRGFAVVADEVRQLSEKTAQSTENIATLVLGIQGDTKSAVTQVKGWKEKISKGIEDSSAASDSIKEIFGHSQTTEKAVQEINDALAEQTSASNMIAQKVEKIAQMTEESQSAAKQVFDVSQEVRELSKSLEQMLSKFSLEKSA